MALKILLADDSMTAQNMGKKILTEAGYEVVAVSNGAQAVKKVASEKPDVAVLDVFMPGYSGLEVCERVKKAQETAHIPVLLTVGKMEPFKPEEGTKAGADGLIVKPFEASDLLAAIKKFEEKLAAPAVEDDTQKVPVVEEFQDSSYEEWKVSAPAEPEPEEVPATQKTEVPQEMSAAPAFGLEGFDEPAAPSPAARTTAAIETPFAAHATEAIEAPMHEQERARSTAEMPAPLQAATGAAAVHAPEEPAATVKLPPEFAAAAAAPFPEESLAMTGSMQAMLQEETKPVEHHEVEFTSAPQAVEVEHAPAPGFEPTVSQEVHEVASGRDPALVTDSDEMAKFTTKFGVEGAEPITVGLASEMPELYADSQPAAEPAPSTDADFEARVAAAMAGYEEPVTQEMPAPLVPEPVPAAAPAPVAFVPEPAPEPPAGPEPVVAAASEPASEPGPGDTATMLAQMQAAVENLPVDTTPNVEATAEPVVTTRPPAPEPVAENVPDHALAAAMAAAVGASVEPQIAAPVAQATAAVARTVDPNVIADVVHRVVERIKPDLAAEIAKELESMLKK